MNRIGAAVEALPSGVDRSTGVLHAPPATLLLLGLAMMGVAIRQFSRTE